MAEPTKTQLPYYGDTNFVTGMRAYAALAVVLIHAGGAGLRQFGLIGNHLADMGHSGVYVFFVISGFSVASSYAGARSYLSYFTRRLWRVVPLYYLWLIIAGVLAQGTNYWGKRFGIEIDLYNVLMHASFLGFVDYRVTNSIIGTEWSIPVEVFWYLLVPFLIRPIVQPRYGMIVAIPLSLMIYLATQRLPSFLPLPTEDAILAVQWSPLPYVFSYCLGMSAFRLRQIIVPRSYDWLIGAVLLLSAAYAIDPPFFSRFLLDDLVVTSCCTFVLICFGSSRSQLCRALFENRAAIYIGTISYGIYLSHLPLKQTIVQIIPGVEGSLGGFLLIAWLAAVISTASYYLLERQCAAFSKRTNRLPHHIHVAAGSSNKVS